MTILDLERRCRRAIHDCPRISSMWKHLDDPIKVGPLHKHTRLIRACHLRRRIHRATSRISPQVSLNARNAEYPRRHLRARRQTGYSKMMAPYGWLPIKHRLTRVGNACTCRRRFDRRRRTAGASGGEQLIGRQGATDSPDPYELTKHSCSPSLSLSRDSFAPLFSHDNDSRLQPRDVFSRSVSTEMTSKVPCKPGPPPPTNAGMSCVPVCVYACVCRHTRAGR